MKSNKGTQKKDTIKLGLDISLELHQKLREIQSEFKKKTGATIAINKIASIYLERNKDNIRLDF